MLGLDLQQLPARVDKAGRNLYPPVSWCFAVFANATSGEFLYVLHLFAVY
jgi:hypothetical protein